MAAGPNSVVPIIVHVMRGNEVYKVDAVPTVSTSDNSSGGTTETLSLPVTAIEQAITAYQAQEPLIAPSVNSTSSHKTHAGSI